MSAWLDVAGIEAEKHLSKQGFPSDVVLRHTIRNTSNKNIAQVLYILILVSIQTFDH